MLKLYCIVSHLGHNLATQRTQHPNHPPLQNLRKHASGLNRPQRLILRKHASGLSLPERPILRANWTPLACEASRSRARLARPSWNCFRDSCIAFHTPFVLTLAAIAGRKIMLKNVTRLAVTPDIGRKRTYSTTWVVPCWSSWLRRLQDLRTYRQWSCISSGSESPHGVSSTPSRSVQKQALKK